VKLIFLHITKFKYFFHKFRETVLNKKNNNNWYCCKLMHRLFKCSDMQKSSFTRDKELNVLNIRNLECRTICELQTFKVVSFWPTV